MRATLAPLITHNLDVRLYVGTCLPYELTCECVCCFVVRLKEQRSNLQGEKWPTQLTHLARLQNVGENNVNHFLRQEVAVLYQSRQYINNVVLDFGGLLLTKPKSCVNVTLYL